MIRTADFRDANNNGVDDRDEGRSRRQNVFTGGAPGYTGQNPTDQTGAPQNKYKDFLDFYKRQNQGMESLFNQQPATQTGGGQVTPKNDTNQQQQNLQQMQNGNAFGYGSMIRDLFGGSNGRDDDGYTFMRDAFQFDTASKLFNTQLGMAQSEHNLAQNKEGMRYANMLDRQTMQESRNHIFGLNMKTMDKQFNLTDEMANRDYGRNLGTMAAFGEQTRKNYAAEGQQQRLGIVTAGEQQRLGYAAQGDQQRKNMRVEGEENRLGYRVQGQEQRKNIAATGFQNRLQSMTEGEQERLNIGKTAKEERATMTHSDFIAAGREKRHNKSAKASARAF